MTKLLDKIAAMYESDYRHVTTLFRGTGYIPTTIPRHRSDALPEPERLAVRYHPTTNVVGIYRTDTPDSGTSYQQAVAYATQLAYPENVTHVVTNGQRWIHVYTQMPRYRRAAMIGITDPMHLTDEDIARALNQPTRGYQSRMVTDPTKPSLNPPKGTQILHNPETGRKRYTWEGYAATGILRWMGANGWTPLQAATTMRTHLGIPVEDNTVLSWVSSGRNAKRGDVPPLTERQCNYLNALRP